MDNKITIKSHFSIIQIRVKRQYNFKNGREIMI